jgi:hypothetical protein
MEDKIQGGYYIKARCIQDSEIATAPPHVREIWDWLLKECNHADNKLFKRGQCMRTFKDIQDGLKWYIGWRKMTYSKWDCEKAMKVLKKATMITTKKTTRGLIITVLNYDFYQDASNYESHTIATRKPQCTDTINKNVKNVRSKKYIHIVKPTIPEIQEYAKSIEFNIDAEHFFNHYEANGWKQSNGLPIKKWQSAIVTWKKNQSKFENKKQSNQIKPPEAKYKDFEGGTV